MAGKRVTVGCDKLLINEPLNECITSVRRASRGSEQLTMGSKGEKVSHSRCFLRNKLKLFRINKKIIPGQRAAWEE